MGDLPEHLQHKSFVRTGSKKTGGPNLRLYRLEHSRPSLTVTAFIFNKFVHPTENRCLTAREAALLQDFPNYYHFLGTQSEVHSQIGNAVPVRLSTAVANSIRACLKRAGYAGEIGLCSFFSGAGGLDLGFHAIEPENGPQFANAFCVDLDKASCATLRRNCPDWQVYCEDIRTFHPPKNSFKHHLVIGGPPCQPFSVAGKQRGTDDPNGQLFRDFFNQIRLIEPLGVVMENVYGLASVKQRGAYREIVKSFKELGYSCEQQELLAADYGTPQLRRRIFFVALHRTVRAKHLWPEPTHGEHKSLFVDNAWNGAGESLSVLPPAIPMSRLAKNN